MRVILSSVAFVLICSFAFAQEFSEEPRPTAISVIDGTEDNISPDLLAALRHLLTTQHETGELSDLRPGKGPVVACGTFRVTDQLPQKFIFNELSATQRLRWIPEGDEDQLYRLYLECGLVAP